MVLIKVLMQSLLLLLIIVLNREQYQRQSSEATSRWCDDVSSPGLSWNEIHLLEMTFENI